jgi:hypothetical protein
MAVGGAQCSLLGSWGLCLHCDSRTDDQTCPAGRAPRAESGRGSVAPRRRGATRPWRRRLTPHTAQGSAMLRTAFFALALAVSASLASAATDDELRQQIVGAWGQDATCSTGALGFAADGTFTFSQPGKGRPARHMGHCRRGPHRLDGGGDLAGCPGRHHGCGPDHRRDRWRPDDDAPPLPFLTLPPPLQEKPRP